MTTQPSFMIEPFKQLEIQLQKTIAIALYDLERYARMSYKDFCDENHVDEGDLRPDIKSHLVAQAFADLAMAQENLKLLTPTIEKYGTHQPLDDLAALARGTLGSALEDANKPEDRAEDAGEPGASGSESTEHGGNGDASAATGDSAPARRAAHRGRTGTAPARPVSRRTHRGGRKQGI